MGDIGIRCCRLAQAANLALEITSIFEKKNDAGFKILADDSRNLVYAIYCANRNEEEGVPQQLERLTVLLDVKVFAEKVSSRTMFSAFIRAEEDAKRMQYYRQELELFLAVFGIDSPEVNGFKLLGLPLSLRHREKLLENKDAGLGLELRPGVGLGSGSRPFGHSLASTQSGLNFSGAGGAGAEINGRTATNHYSIKKGENVSIGRLAQTSDRIIFSLGFSNEGERRSVSGF